MITLVAPHLAFFSSLDCLDCLSGEVLDCLSGVVEEEEQLSSSSLETQAGFHPGFSSIYISDDKVSYVLRYETQAGFHHVQLSCLKTMTMTITLGLDHLVF